MTWIIVYFCVFKGVKSSSYVVWVTVPLPCFFILLMVINGVLLDGAGDGLMLYLTGKQFDGTRPPFLETIANGAMWGEACGQIFFSVGVCMGVMTSYSSYNPPEKAIIGDSFLVAFGNSGLSFVAGFAVFSIVGYLNSIDPVLAAKSSSLGLAFIAYPSAVDTMKFSNLWAFVLALTLFTLGIDSAFSLVEATSTVIYDTPWGRKTPRKLTALVLCVAGACFSALFTSNAGFTYFDVVDHYLANYLMLLLGVLQCFGAAWVLEAGSVMDRVNKASVLVLALGYWIPCLLIPFIFIFFAPKLAAWSILIFWIIQVIVAIISFVLSKLSFKVWYNKVFLYGVCKLSRAITRLSHDEESSPWWVGLFEAWWGISIKYMIPWAVYNILVLLLKSDIDEKYGGYHMFWQWMGFAYPIVGLVCFIVPIFLCTTAEPDDEELDKAFNSMMAEHDDYGTQKEGGETELKQIN